MALNEKDENLNAQDDKNPDEKNENSQKVQNDSSSEKAADAGQEKTDGTGEAEKDAEKSDAGKSDAGKSDGEKAEKVLTPEEKIAALEKENAELKDQLLRRAADFDNYRKRMMKEKQDTYDYANAALLSDLLESLDNLDRAVEAAKDAKDVKSVADGVKMINKSLVKLLEDKYGLSSYGKEGDEFNPDEHEAIGRMEDPKAKKETLKQVYLKGFKLKDKVIRHAKVMVSVPQA